MIKLFPNRTFGTVHNLGVDDLEFEPRLWSTSHLKSVGSCLLRESL